MVKHMLRRERVFKDRFSETTEWLRSRYRFPKTNLMDLCRDLQPMLEREAKRTEAIPAHIQLLSTLGFWPPGHFTVRLETYASFRSQHLFMPVVLDAIISLASIYIQFPYALHQQAQIKRGFHAIAGLPVLQHLEVIFWVSYDLI